ARQTRFGSSPQCRRYTPFGRPKTYRCTDGRGALRLLSWPSLTRRRFANRLRIPRVHRLLRVMPFFVAVAAGAFEEKPVSDLTLETVFVQGRAAAWNGRNFVIAFDAPRISSHHVFRALLDGDGNVLDSREIAPKLSESVTSIATDGERYLVRFDSGPGLLLDENGNPLRADVPPSSWSAKMAASDGSSYLVAGFSGGVQLLDRNGDPVGGPIAVPNPEQVRAIAEARSGYAVVTGILDGETDRLYIRTLRHGVFSERIEADTVRFGSEVHVAS